MMRFVWVHRARRALHVAALTGALALLAGASPVVDEVYDERNYQKDLPGSPGSCQGDDCAEADSDAVADSRLRGADSTYTDQSFGQGEAGGDYGEGSGGAGGGMGMRKGSIRGEFEGTSEAPSKCELVKRAGGDDDSIECREEFADAGSGDGVGGGAGSGEGTGSGSGGEWGQGGAGMGGNAGGRGAGDGSGGGGQRGGERGSGGESGGERGSGEGGGESDSQGSDQNPGKRGNEQHGDKQPTADQPPQPVEPPEPTLPEEEPMPEVEPEQQPPSLLDLLQTVMIVLGVVLLVVILALVVRAIMRRVQAGGTDRAEIDEEVEGAEELIHELEQRTRGRSHGDWAQEMRYEEAIHALLLEAIKATLRHRRDLARPSTTSREILRDAQLDATQHAALETLVRAAELCVFARRQGTEAMYKACVQAHATLCESLERASMPVHTDDREVA